MKTNLSAVVLTKNEEKNLKDALMRLGFCDEIVVIDDFSEDQTVSIAKKFGAKVFQRKLGGNFAEQRNFGLECATGRWILFIDADERVTPELAREILELVKNEENEVRGALIERSDVIYGKKVRFGEFGKNYILRFGRKGSGLWKRRIHETWHISGKLLTLNGKLIHYSGNNLSKVVAKLNTYSTLHAIANLEEGKKSGLQKIIFLPPLKFIYNYILKFAIFDKEIGFLTSLFMSFHSYLAWSKLWLIQKRKAI